MDWYDSLRQSVHVRRVQRLVSSTQSFACFFQWMGADDVVAIPSAFERLSILGA